MLGRYGGFEMRITEDRLWINWAPGTTRTLGIGKTRENFHYAEILGSVGFIGLRRNFLDNNFKFLGRAEKIVIQNESCSIARVI